MSAKSEELLFDFWTKVKVTNAFPGDWESIFKGAGDEFFELREYESGDDWRKIDWAKVAETGKLYVRENVALRDLRITILLDLSKGMYFHEKPNIVNTFIAVTGAAALRRGFPLGLVAYRDEVTDYLPARAGRTSLAEIAQWYSETAEPPSHPVADLTGLARFVLAKVPSRSLLFLVSDFLDPQRDFRALEILARTFDVVSVILRDPFERDLPLNGEVEVLDLFSKSQSTLVFGPKERELFRQLMEEDVRSVASGLEERGVDHILLDSPDVGDCVRVLQELFWLRKVKKI